MCVAAAGWNVTPLDILIALLEALSLIEFCEDGTNVLHRKSDTSDIDAYMQLT